MSAQGAKLDKKNAVTRKAITHYIFSSPEVTYCYWLTSVVVRRTVCVVRRVLNSLKLQLYRLMVSFQKQVVSHCPL